MITQEISKNKQAVKIAFDKGYRIRDNEVYSHKGNKLKPQLKKCNSGNYKSFKLYVDKLLNTRTTSVMYHHLLAYEKYGDIFFSPNIHVRHLNGLSTDNSWNNIELGTPSQNMMDKDPLTRRIHAITTSWNNRRFTDDEIKQIKIDRLNGLTYNDLIEKYKTAKGTLSFLFNHALYYKHDTLEDAIQYMRDEYLKNQ
jgi:hypothetical protein